MPRKLLRRVIPDRETVHQRAGLARRWLGEDDLWHLGRRPVARAVSVGCFWALLPCDSTLAIQGASQSPKSKPADRQDLISTR